MHGTTLSLQMTYMNLPTMPIDDSPRKKVPAISPDTIPFTIYFASKISIVNLNSPCDSPQDIIVTYYVTKIYHTMMIDEYHCDNIKIVYGAKRHDVIIRLNFIIIIFIHVLLQ